MTITYLIEGRSTTSPHVGSTGLAHSPEDAEREAERIRAHGCDVVTIKAIEHN